LRCTQRVRRSELLGLRWIDYDAKAGVLTVTGKVIRVPGQGLLRVDETKSTAGRRTIPLPRFAIDMLEKRRQLPYVGQQPVIFPSTSGTLRDPNNFGKEWRTARQELGVAEVTTHSFRKTVATLIDDEGLSARIGADHLGQVGGGDRRDGRPRGLAWHRWRIQADDGVKVRDGAALHLGDFHIADANTGGGFTHGPLVAVQKSAQSDGEAPPQLGGVPREQDVPGVVVAVIA